MKTINNKTKLEYQVLKVLHEHYACAEEIKRKLQSAQIDYPGKFFFPILSHLQLNSFLCYNWNKESGKPVKYFHLTPKGENYFNNITVN